MHLLDTYVSLLHILNALPQRISTRPAPWLGRCWAWVRKMLGKTLRIPLLIIRKLQKIAMIFDEFCVYPHFLRTRPKLMLTQRCRKTSKIARELKAFRLGIQIFLPCAVNQSGSPWFMLNITDTTSNTVPTLSVDCCRGEWLQLG